MMKWRLILILLLIALAVYGATRLERRSYVVHPPVTGEAWRNPMLAAGKLMLAEGRSVRHLVGSPSLFPLPGTDTLIVMDSHRASLNTPRIEALYGWVAAGGTLVVAATPMQSLDSEYAATAQRWQRHDPLLYPLNITAHLPAEGTFDEPESSLLFADMFSSAASLFQSFCHAAEDSVLAEECVTALCTNRLRWHDTEVYTLDAGLRYAGFNPRITLWHTDLYRLRDVSEDNAHGDAHPDTHLNTRLNTPAPHLPIKQDDGRRADYEKNAATRYEPGEQKAYSYGEVQDTSQDSYVFQSDDPVSQLMSLQHLLYTSGMTLTGHADSDIGTHLLQVEIGEGRVIAASDLGLWENDRLHYLDHAWLLNYFARESQAVWFVRGVDVERLPAWLWRHTAPLLLALLLLIALLVWRQLPRRAAILEDETTRPGDFLGHLLASGRLLWRTGDQSGLLTPLREEVVARLARHPQSRSLDDAGRIALAARLSKVPEDDVRAALTDTPDTPERLTTLVGTLQQLRRNL